MSDPLLPDLRDVPKDDGPAAEPEQTQAADPPITDPEGRESARATGKEQAEENRRTENPT